MSKFSQKFEVHKSGSEESPTLILSGAIMENAVFPMHEVNNSQILTLDLKGVTRINSSGIRLWMQWMGGIKALSPQAVLIVRYCPRFIVDLMNGIRDFLPSPFIVQSFYVPFFCEKCNAVKDELFTRNVNFRETDEEPDKVALPKVICSGCNSEMEPDFFPESYFRFLKHVKQGLHKA